MIDYFCAHILTTRADIRGIKNRLKSQATFNKTTKLIMGLLIAQTFLDMVKDRITDQQIKNLQHEVEELKSAKGE